MSRKNVRHTARSPLLTYAPDLFRDPAVLLRRFQERASQTQLPIEVRPDTWVPAIEITQNENRIEVLVELPGIEWMDVRAEVIGDRLVVQGERRHDIPSDVIPRAVRRSERQYGHFYREIELPQGADVEHMEAKLNNGILRITIPVSGEQTTGRQLPVHTSSTSSEEQG